MYKKDRTQKKNNKLKEGQDSFYARKKNSCEF